MSTLLSQRKKPDCLYTQDTPSGAHLVRFNSFYDMTWYDDPKNNPRGHSISNYNQKSVQKYIKDRFVLTPKKQRIIAEARKAMKRDKDFLSLVYKSATEKRKFVKNKFGGNLNMAAYASNQDKIFSRSKQGAKKSTLDMAFQVGTFSGGDYTGSFISILKTVFMCQALGIQLNIDLFDSDTRGVQRSNAYVICNVANSRKKLNLRDILVGSHSEFFNYTLFNGYSGSGKNTGISSFLGHYQIVEDLGERYDVIGGNMLPRAEEGEHGDMIRTILKIGFGR